MSLFTPSNVQAPSDSEMVATTPDYRRVQQMVDQLSDAGFAVDRLAIVWDGLQQVEHVTGRVTTWKAAAQGAVAGAWFGGIIGWLFAMFSPEGWAVFLTYLVVGAIAGAVWKGVGHAMQRGRRDFDTVSTLAAHEYQLWCDTALVPEAQRLLGTPHDRPVDPRH